MPHPYTSPQLSAVGQGRSVAQTNRNLPDKLRAREPISRSFGLIRGKFPSQKVGRMIHWESQLERDAVILFEFSRGVISYREQPLTTYYALDGKVRRYTPDFEITLFTGEVVLIEVKPSEKLLDPKESTRLRRIAEHFAETGSAYRILTEIELRPGDLLANLQMVFRYREAKLSPFERRKISEQIRVAEEMTFGEATALLGAKSLVWILIAEHLLFCDLRHPVTEKTVLFTGIREGWDEELYF